MQSFKRFILQACFHQCTSSRRFMTSDTGMCWVRLGIWTVNTIELTNPCPAPMLSRKRFPWCDSIWLFFFETSEPRCQDARTTVVWIYDKPWHKPNEPNVPKYYQSSPFVRFAIWNESSHLDNTFSNKIHLAHSSSHSRSTQHTLCDLSLQTFRTLRNSFDRT